MFSWKCTLWGTLPIWESPSWGVLWSLRWSHCKTKKMRSWKPPTFLGYLFFSQSSKNNTITSWTYKKAFSSLMKPLLKQKDLKSKSKTFFKLSKSNRSKTNFKAWGETKSKSLKDYKSWTKFRETEEIQGLNFWWIISKWSDKSCCNRSPRNSKLLKNLLQISKASQSKLQVWFMNKEWTSTSQRIQ